MNYIEKAKELVNKFYQPLGYLKCGVSTSDMWEYAKQRAIETCDEIYFAIYNYLKDTDELQNADREFAYWEKVKQAINEL